MRPNYPVKDKSNQFKADHNQKSVSNGESKCYRNVNKKKFSKTKKKWKICQEIKTWKAYTFDKRQWKKPFR